jgi:poly(3-hydroxybutyrate) depolymerase
VLARFQSSESFGRLQYAGSGPLLREYMVDPQHVYIDALSAGAAAAAIIARPTPVFLPQSAYILSLAPPPIFSSLGRLTGILRADHARARTTTSKRQVAANLEFL